MDTLYLIPGGRKKKITKCPKMEITVVFTLKYFQNKGGGPPSNLKKMQQRDKVTSLYCSNIFARLMLGHVMNLGQT